MSSVNKVILVGRLGKDPETRFLGNGDLVANLTLATSEQWKSKGTGEKNEVTEWHKLVFFGKIAEVIRDYCKKGAQIYVEGKLKTRKWQDSNGQDKYTTEIHCNTMKLLGGRKDSDDNAAVENSQQLGDDIPF